MGVLQTTTTSLLEEITGAQNARVEYHRTRISNSKRLLLKMQIELSAYKSSETLILQRMNRTLKQEEIEKLTADRYQTINPIQVVKTYDKVRHDPDPRIRYTQRQINEGMENMKIELNRVQAQINDLSSQIRQMTDILAQLSVDLEQMGDPDKVLIEQERDLIAKRWYSELYMLNELSIKYYELSSIKENGQRSFSKKPAIVRQYDQINLTFNAYAQRNYFVISGEIPVELNGDPGSEFNRKLLREKLDRMRTVYAKNTLEKLDPRLDKYRDQMISNLNDPFVSKNVSRQEVEKRIPEKDTAWNKVVTNVQNVYDKVNAFLEAELTVGPIQQLNKFFWDGEASRKEAVQKMTQNELYFLYGKKPFCTDPLKTPEEVQQEENDSLMQTAEDDAGLILITQFNSTAKKVDFNAIQAAFDQKKASIQNIINTQGASYPVSPYYAQIAGKTYRITDSRQKKIIISVQDAYLYLEDAKIQGVISSEWVEVNSTELINLLTRAGIHDVDYISPLDSIG